MVLNRHYCQHTSVVTDNIVAHMNEHIVKYVIAIVLNRHYCQHTSVKNR